MLNKLKEDFKIIKILDSSDENYNPFFHQILFEGKEKFLSLDIELEKLPYKKIKQIVQFELS